MSLAKRIRIKEVKTLSDDWYVLKKTTFDWKRSDGTWQTQSRETYDRGDGVALVPYDRKRRTVMLIRQFRYPAYVNGAKDLLIEAAAGLLDDADPVARMRSELEEEMGLRLTGEITKVFACFMSPGAVTERLHLFVAEYDAKMRVGEGGGVEGEAEDIEVLELGFDDAMSMVASGEIQDAKTIMLLQHLAMTVFAKKPRQRAAKREAAKAKPRSGRR